MFTLNLVTPEKKLVTETEIEEVIVPGFKGELNILPGHAPLITTLSTGSLKYRLKGSTRLETVVVSWGYCEVNQNGVTVLAETAEAVGEIDRARAQEALRQAQEKLMGPILEPDQMEAIQRKIQRAQARLNVVAGNETTH